MKVLLSIVGFIVAIGVAWIALVLAMDAIINRPWKKINIKRNKYDFD